MILVLDNEVQPDYRYLGPEIDRILSESDYRVAADDPEPPSIDPYDGVVLSGSTASVYEDEHADWLAPQRALVRRCVEERIPLLGVCFGHQLVNDALGGEVKKDRRRATFVEMTPGEADPLFEGVEPIVPVLHADLVTELGEGMEPIAATAYNDYFCSRHRDAPIWTVQFHPEFTERVSDRPSDWDPGDYAFEDSSAARILRNFERLCEDRSRRR